jgi:hypothetical protein
MNNKMTRYFVIMLLCLLISGCEVMRPVPAGLKATMPGPPDYTKGWEDGCFTGMAAMSNSYYQSFYHFRQDPSMTTNQMYYQAWKDSYVYCRQYVLTWVHVPIDAAEDTDPNK